MAPLNNLDPVSRRVESCGCRCAYFHAAESLCRLHAAAPELLNALMAMLAKFDPIIHANLINEWRAANDAVTLALESKL